MTEVELRAENVHGHRWWTLEELQASDARFAPRTLPSLVQDLLQNGPATIPTRVGL
jgi:hypothetical protein